MKKALEIINQLETEGVLQGYAMGGATALFFYAEPALTFDIDIFVFLPENTGKSGLIDLSSLYSALKNKGYLPEKEHVFIEGVPVQFIPAYNELIEEAVKNAVLKDYEGVKVKVVQLEYLLAIMMDTNRPKDRERIGSLINEVKINNDLLKSILERHKLQKNWEQLLENS